MPLRIFDQVVGEDELALWHAWEEEFGIPDAYFTVGLLAPAIAGALGGAKCSARDFVPYFASQLGDLPQDPDEQREIMAAKLSSLRHRS